MVRSPLPPRLRTSSPARPSTTPTTAVAVPPRRLVVVSHRGPGGCGGVATGLDALLRRTGGCWVSSDAGRRAYPLLRVSLSDRELRRYYAGYANQGLWPLCHGLVERAVFRAEDWAGYREVNQRFAEAAARAAAPGATVWIQDYQLALVPAALRRLRPDLRVGFFWHIPWPAPAIWRLCPHGREIVAGIEAASLIGFHTPQYVRDFRAVAAMTAPARALPMGIDFAAIATLAGDPTTARRMRRLETALHLKGKLLVGVDRCDYTKGLPQRLAAVRSLLARWPEYRGQITYVQVAAPTREGVAPYDRLGRQLRHQARRLNRDFGTPGWKPVRWIPRRLNLHQLVALYRLADVALVTPLADGMNLVAKEFVAARVDERGTLLLSPTAGAATQMPEAVAVNPLDPDGFAEAIRDALAMSPHDQARRMIALRTDTARHDIYRWLTENLAGMGVAIGA